MAEKSNWNKFATWLKKAWRIIWKKYQKEIRAFVSGQVDSAFMELSKHVDSSVQKKIRDDIVARAIYNKVDIYSISGAEWVKNEITSYMEKLGGGE